MSCRAAATLTSYGDEKALFPAVSKVRSSGCVRWGRVKSGSSRKKKWKHARLQGQAGAAKLVFGKFRVKVLHFMRTSPPATALVSVR